MRGAKTALCNSREEWEYFVSPLVTLLDRMTLRPNCYRRVLLSMSLSSYASSCSVQFGIAHPLGHAWLSCEKVDAGGYAAVFTI